MTVPSLGKGSIVRLYGRNWQATDVGWEALDNQMDNEAAMLAMRRLEYPSKF